MKVQLIAALLFVGSIISMAGCDELRMAIWHGLKNTANDLNDYNIPTKELLPATKGIGELE